MDIGNWIRYSKCRVRKKVSQIIRMVRGRVGLAILVLSQQSGVLFEKGEKTKSIVISWCVVVSYHWRFSHLPLPFEMTLKVRFGTHIFSRWTKQCLLIYCNTLWIESTYAHISMRTPIMSRTGHFCVIPRLHPASVECNLELTPTLHRHFGIHQRQ